MRTSFNRIVVPRWLGTALVAMVLSPQHAAAEDRLWVSAKNGTPGTALRSQPIGGCFSAEERRKR